MYEVPSTWLPLQHAALRLLWGCGTKHALAGFAGAAPNPRLTCLLTASQGGAAARPHQAPPAQPNVAGSSRLVPLEIGDDGDDELAIGGNATALHAADDWLSAPTQKRSDTIDPVIVESNRAWIGAL